MVNTAARSPSKILRHLIPAVLAPLLISLPSAGYAALICEQGRITHFHLTGGNTSTLVVVSDNVRPEQPKWPLHGKFGTAISPGSLVRWRDRLALLRTAFALQLPVMIVANKGSDCIGLTDEFEITVCRSGIGCGQ